MVRAQAAILTTLRAEVKALEKQVDTHFGKHPDAEIYLSQPGLAVTLGARVLAEFGDDKTRYADAKARKNYAGTSPITRQSGKKKTVLARHVHNDRLVDALGLQALSALNASSGARTYYDQLRPAVLAIEPRRASSATASSVSCTAASRPAQNTAKTPPGHNTEKIFKPPLDNIAHGMSLRSL